MDFKTQIKSTVATGTAPLNIASTTVIPNLNADLLDGNHASAFLTTSGNAASATKLVTARSIALGTGVTSTATNFDGTANISIPVTGISEAYLTWGGRNLTGSYAPIDAAMVPALGANRFAFTPPGAVIVEYSRDNGATWIDYGTSDSNKINLLCGLSGNIQVGGGGYAAGTDYTTYQVRLTINTGTGSIYTALNKFVLYISTNGSTGSWCTIDARLQSNYTGAIDTWTIFADKVPIGGWSGYNVINTSNIITYGNTPASQYGQVRFTFGQTGYNVSYTGLQILSILGFGGVGWITPSTLASTGLIYTYDYNKNVTFPANITSPAFVTTIADTTGTASHYYVETSTDGVVRPKPLSNVRTEIVTRDAVNAAAATTVGIITSGVWNGTEIPVANGGTGATTAAAALTNLGLTATAAELNYTDGVTSNIQTQLNAKAASSHVHGNITNAGAIGTTADLMVKTTTSGVLTTLAAGTAGQFLTYNGTWATPPDTNTTYSNATTSISGLMSNTDKAKLDGVAANANNYSLPVASATLGGVKSGTDITVDASGNVSVNDDSHNHVIANVDGLQIALDGKSATTHNHTLDGLSNTTITSNTTGEILKWDGTAWVNNTLAEAGIQATLAAGHGDTINPYASKTTKYFLAAPNAADGVPTFRAIVASDIPTLNQSTTGTAANVTGTVAIANGGTGATTAAAALTNLGLTATAAELNFVDGVTSAIQTQLNSKLSAVPNASTQVSSLGVGTAASGTAGEIRATNNITAYYSDARLKDFLGTIPNALDKVLALNGYYFIENEEAKSLGYDNDRVQLGVSAQEVQAILPEAVTGAPIGGDYLTVWYEKLVPVLIEAIKEQQKQIDELRAKVGK